MSNPKKKRQHRPAAKRPTAKKIKIIKVEQIEPEKHRVELEIESAPVAAPEAFEFPVELEASEILGEVQEIPEVKKGLIAWLKSWLG